MLLFIRKLSREQTQLFKNQQQTKSQIFKFYETLPEFPRVNNFEDLEIIKRVRDYEEINAKTDPIDFQVFRNENTT